MENTAGENTDAEGVITEVQDQDGDQVKTHSLSAKKSIMSEADLEVTDDQQQHRRERSDSEFSFGKPSDRETTRSARKSLFFLRKKSLSSNRGTISDSKSVRGTISGSKSIRGTISGSKSVRKKSQSMSGQSSRGFGSARSTRSARKTLILEDVENLPMDGVSLNSLVEWYEDSGIEQGTKTNELLKVVLKQTLDMKCSLARRLKATRSDSTIPVAEYYVINPWSYRFREDVLESLITFKEEQNLDDMFVWLDIVCLNQHWAERHARTYDWFNNASDHSTKHSFHKDIERFDKILLVWSQWEEALPLKSAWCTWEMYIAISSNIPLDICMTKPDEADFRKTILSTFEPLIKTIQSFDVNTTKGYHKHHTKRVLKAVEKLKKAEDQSGLMGFNEEIIYFLESFFLDMAMDIADSSAYMNTVSPEYCELLTAFGVLLRKHDRLPESQAICEKCVELGKTVYGQTVRAEQARHLNNLAVVLGEQQKINQSIRVHQEALSVMQQVYGNSNIYVANDQNNLACLLAEQDRFVEAENLFSQSIKIKVNFYGAEHPIVADALSNLGLLYYSMKKNDAAEKMMRNALQISENVPMEDEEIAKFSSRLSDILLASQRRKKLEEAKTLANEAVKLAKKAGNCDDLVQYLSVKYINNFTK